MAAEFRPDIVLLDIGLPKLNGMTRPATSRAAWGKRMVLIAVTGWGQDEDRRHTQQAGFDHHLVKPVDPDRLLAVLAEVGSPDAPPSAVDVQQPRR